LWFKHKFIVLFIIIFGTLSCAVRASSGQVDSCQCGRASSGQVDSCQCGHWRNDWVAAASSDGGPTGGRGPPTVLFYFRSEGRGPDVRK